MTTATAPLQLMHEKRWLLIGKTYNLQHKPITMDVLMELNLDENDDGEIVFGYRNQSGDEHYLFSDDRNGTYRVEYIE